MENLTIKIVNKLNMQNKTISLMESCSGGFLANKITNVSGASNVLKVSLVTYSNEYKLKFGVPKTIIDKYTVYSIETAKEMAKNVSLFANSNYGIGITGELANKKREENKVYFAIFDRDNNSFIEKVLLLNPDEREKMKEVISNAVWEELWNILTIN